MAEIIRIEDLMERQAGGVTKLEFEARKIYLESYISTVRRLEDIQNELVELQYAIGPGAGCGNGMPRSSRVSDGSDRIIHRMQRIDDLRGVIIREEQALIRRRDEIAKVIDAVTNGAQQEVLQYRYVRDMDIGEIADKMNYSYRQVQNIHNRAVQRIKPPRRAIAKIKAELMEVCPEWANIQVKAA